MPVTIAFAGEKGLESICPPWLMYHERWNAYYTDSSPRVPEKMKTVFTIGVNQAINLME